MNKSNKKLILFILLPAVLLFVSPTADAAVMMREPQETISGDSTPRIDTEAAAVVKEDGTVKKVALCLSLPENAWVLLVGVYIALIIFNLTYKIREEKNIRWFWESLYTILALLAWYYFDECRTHNWFPPVIIETGLIIYAFYLYYFNKPKIKKEEDKNLRLPLE